MWSPSFFCVWFTTIVISLDFSVSVISFQPFWLALGGNEKAAGFAFVCFDFITVFSGPIIGSLADRFSYKWSFITGLVVIISGNLLYCFADLIGNWRAVFAGRLIGGIGAGIFPLTTVYVGCVMPPQDQATMIGYLAYTFAVSRVLGPLIAGFFLYYLKPEPDASTVEKIFNGFTIPTWIATLLAVICLAVSLQFFKDPEKRAKKTSKQEQDLSHQDSTVQMRFFSKEMLIYARKLLPVWFIQMVGTFFYWGYTGNLFFVAAINYGLFDSAKDLWRSSMGTTGGFIISFFIYMLSKNYLRELNTVSMVVIAVGMLLYYPFYNKPMHSAFFYLGSGVTTMGYATLIPAIQSTNSIMSKGFGKYSAFFVALIISFGALARVAGSTLFTVIVNYDHSNSTVCSLTNEAEHYVYQTCEIKNLGPMVIATVVLLLCGAVMAFFFLPKRSTILQIVSASRQIAVSNGKHEEPEMVNGGMDTDTLDRANNTRF